MKVQHDCRGGHSPSGYTSGAQGGKHRRCGRYRSSDAARSEIELALNVRRKPPCATAPVLRSIPDRYVKARRNECLYYVASLARR
jgi:hypothetical protein